MLRKPLGLLPQLCARARGCWLGWVLLLLGQKWPAQHVEPFSTALLGQREELPGKSSAPSTRKNLPAFSWRNTRSGSFGHRRFSMLSMAVSPLHPLSLHRGLHWGISEDTLQHSHPFLFLLWQGIQIITVDVLPAVEMGLGSSCSVLTDLLCKHVLVQPLNMVMGTGLSRKGGTWGGGRCLPAVTSSCWMSHEQELLCCVVYCHCYHNHRGQWEGCK